MFGWRIKTISITRLAEKLAAGSPVLIDVREPHEFAEGHVPGAVNVPLGTLASRAAAFDASVETLVICEKGHRSKSGVRVLKRAGFTDARSIAGGTSAWRGDLERWTSPK